MTKNTKNITHALKIMTTTMEEKKEEKAKKNNNKGYE